MEGMRIPGLRLELDAELPWRPTRWTGVSWLPLHLDEPEGPAGSSRGAGDAGASGRRPGATVLIRMEPGCAYAAHRHVGSEDVLVLSGGYADEDGEYRAGEHVHYPPGSTHAPRALGAEGEPIGAENPPCILYSSVPDGIELLEEGPERRR